MRLITVEQEGDRVVLRVYHDGEMDSLEAEEFDAIVLTELYAAAPFDEERLGLGYEAIALEFVRVDAPAPISAKGLAVYGRKERA